MHRESIMNYRNALFGLATLLIGSLCVHGQSLSMDFPSDDAHVGGKITLIASPIGGTPSINYRFAVGATPAGITAEAR